MISYIYKVVASDEEKSICSLEARIMLEANPIWFGQVGFIFSCQNINIHRSAYIKWKLETSFSATCEAELIKGLEAINATMPFRMNYLNGYQYNQLELSNKQMRRAYEKKYGSAIKGTVQLTNPAIQYGILRSDDHYYVGIYEETNNTWQQHIDKPCQYSTALSTRLARTITNIAIPQPRNKLSFVDPCCGIGTVLLEAAGLGVKASGFDINPLVLKGTRENLAYYHYDVLVEYKDMLTIEDYYDAAVLDLPYNLCSVLPEELKIAMLQKLQTISSRYVIISVEPIGVLLKKLNIPIIDYAEHFKGKFKREVFLCGK